MKGLILNEAPQEISLAQSTLLLFISSGSEQLDPIRVMKGLFVFTMEAPDAWLPRDARYDFVPYSYGPYSSQISSDLDYFASIGHLNAIRPQGRSWKYYSISDKGKVLTEQLASSFKPEALNYLRQLREYILKLSFRQLLDAVYTKYPEYAVNSVFKS